MAINVKIKKVVAALKGEEFDPNTVCGCTIESCLDELADAIAENEILHPTTTTEQTPAAETPAGGGEETPAAGEGTETQTQGEGGTP